MRTVSDYIKTGMSVYLNKVVSGLVTTGVGLKGQYERPGCYRHEEMSLTTRVYYLPVAMLHLATSVARSNLISLGTCFGKFSKTGKFKLGITSLDWLAKYAKYKVRLERASARMTRLTLIRADELGLGKTIRRTPVLIWKPRLESPFG